MKNYRRFAGVLAIVVFAFLNPPVTHAGTVTLTGEGKVHFVPDAARFFLSTQTRGDTAREARAAAGSRVTAWEQAVGQVMGKLQDYDDSMLAVREVTKHDDHGKPTNKRFFEASQTIRFSLTDLDHLNKVIASAEQAGLSYHLSEDSYFPTQRKELEQAALAAAIEDAKARCAFIAQRLGGRCGSVETLRVLDQGHYPRPMATAMDRSRESVIHIGDREITATVEASFELN